MWRAAVIAALALVAIAAASAPAARRAVLRPVAGDPFRVQGSRFLAGERVRVTVTPTGRTAIVRRVTASHRGRFVLTYRGIRSCAGVHGVARGSRGSRAAFQLSSVRC